MNKIKTSTGKRGIQVYNSVMENLEIYGELFGDLDWKSGKFE